MASKFDKLVDWVLGEQEVPATSPEILNLRKELEPIRALNARLGQMKLTPPKSKTDYENYLTLIKAGEPAAAEMLYPQFATPGKANEFEFQGLEAPAHANVSLLKQAQAAYPGQSPETYKGIVNSMTGGSGPLSHWQGPVKGP
tara:strand:+ start:1451 stop:1879 length:429 start_codon:yes stop_codon:yes gene_type:complete